MLSPLKIAIFLFPLGFFVKTSAQVFNSVFAMEELYDTQSDVLKRIQAYVDTSKEKLKIVKQVLNDFEKIHAIVMEDVDNILVNAIYRFYLLLGLTHNFKLVERTLKDIPGYVRNTKLLYPSQADVYGAMLGILRLQETYDLQVSDLAQGLIISDNNKDYKPILQQVTPMTSWDCFEMSLMPFPNNTQGFRTKIKWLTVALEKYHRWQECLFCTLLEEDIVDHLIRAHHHAGDPDGEIRWLRKRIALTPNDYLNYEREKMIKNLENFKYINQLDKKISAEVHEPMLEYPSDIGGKRWMLQGCIEKFNESDDSGVCMYDTFNPSMVLSPAKLELLRITPPIAMYHDFLTDNEIKYLIGLAKKGKMVTGVVQKKDISEMDKKLGTDNGRVVKQVALNESIEDVAKIINRMKEYSGLNFDSSGPLDILNYGIGGYIGGHYDPIIETPPPAPAQVNERSATIILFLSEATLGGALVFPKLGLQFFPERGAALIFDSVYPSGVINWATKHLLCPIIAGDRWAALKFLNEDDQTQCPLWYDQGDKVFTEDGLKLFSDHQQQAEQKSRILNMILNLDLT